MSPLKGLFGNRKQEHTASTLPRCASCGFPVPMRVRGVAPFGRQLPFTGELPKGVELFEGTECPACGNGYCLDCHDFAAKGPKCPNCGRWELKPIMRKFP